MTDRLKEIVKNIPFNPGIYMMKDESGNIIYVGKAISLRKRVRHYFQKNNKSKRIESMVSNIHDISYIVTRNEVEALVLECNYIKENRPKYNVMLKDDKTYPYIKIKVNDKYPTILVTRKKIDDKALYFGPYTNTGAMRDTLNTIKQIFPIKRCKYNLSKKTISRPCLYYHLGKCLGPCINDVSKEEYSNMIGQVVMFLQGKTNDIKVLLEKQMEDCIENLKFEQAALIKKRIDDIEKVSIKQTVANLNENSTDIFAFIFQNNKLYIQIFKIRNYKVVLHDNIEIDDIIDTEVDEQVLHIISTYYIEVEDIPKKVYVKLEEHSIELLNEYFKEKNIKIQIICPKKGEKLDLIKMVENNIKINIESKKDNVVDKLKNIIGRLRSINSIESFDISNLRNEYIVGCMIRFEDNKLNKKKYRKFKIRSTLTQDDPKCMYEVISRRLKHKDEWELPDLFLIDGGKTQLQMVKKALSEANEDGIDVYGMVKNNKHRTSKLIDMQGNYIDISSNKDVLNFLTFIQDEVHRFTISYHRKLRDSIK